MEITVEAYRKIGLAGLISTITCIMVYTVVTVIMAWYRENIYFHVYLLVWATFVYPTLALCIIMEFSFYRAMRKWVDVRMDRCASCGAPVRRSSGFPLCDRCYVDSRVIEYCMLHGFVPAVDAGMYLTEGKPLKRPVAWGEVWNFKYPFSPYALIFDYPWAPVIMYFILMGLSFFFDILSMECLVMIFIYGSLTIPTWLVICLDYYREGWARIIILRKPEYMIKAREWRKRARERIERAAGMLHMNPEETARLIYLVYMEIINDVGPLEGFITSPEEAKKCPEGYMGMIYPFFYEGLPLGRAELEGDERMRVLRVIDEVWLAEREFAVLPPLEGPIVIPIIPLGFSFVIWDFSIYPNLSSGWFGRVINAGIMWSFLVAWVLFSIPGLRMLVRMRGRRALSWVAVPVVMGIAGMSGLLFQAGGEEIIDVILDGGYVPWLVGRIVGAIAIGMAEGVAVSAVRRLKRWIVAGGLLWGALSVIVLEIVRWMYVESGNMGIAFSVYMAFIPCMMIIVGIFMLKSGMRATWAGATGAIMGFSEYVALLAVSMSVI